MVFLIADEEWVAARLAQVMEEHGEGNEEEDWQAAASRLDVPIVRVNVPGAAPACYVPELFTSNDACGVIILNMIYGAGQRARALRHEIGHHLLWPPAVNRIFGRRFEIDPDTDAYSLRERIVQRAERLCFSK